MLYVFALLAVVALAALWRIGTALWSIFAQLRGIARIGVDVHNVWNERANDIGGARERAETLKS